MQLPGLLKVLTGINTRVVVAANYHLLFNPHHKLYNVATETWDMGTVEICQLLLLHS